MGGRADDDDDDAAKQASRAGAAERGLLFFLDIDAKALLSSSSDELPPLSSNPLSVGLPRRWTMAVDDGGWWLEREVVRGIEFGLVLYLNRGLGTH